MKKENVPLYILIFGVILLLASFLFVKKDDVGLSREIFNNLLAGNQFVHKSIDWEHFQAFGFDIGRVYRALPDNKEKADYRKEFIKNLSSNFRKLGGNAGLFTDWRVYIRKGKDTIVAAYYKNKDKTILLILSGYGRKKLTSIQWESKDGQ